LKSQVFIVFAAAHPTAAGLPHNACGAIHKVQAGHVTKPGIWVNNVRMLPVGVSI